MEEDRDANVEQWKIKRLIKKLENAKGNGTSMISLIIKNKDEVSRINKMLADELGTASNIKSRVNRLSVLSAITSTQQSNKNEGKEAHLYCAIPLCIRITHTRLKQDKNGTVITEDGKEKKMSIDFEPFRPINTSLYLCDNKFHVEALKELLESDDKFGFIIVDGNGALFGTIQGNTREVIRRFTVDLPKKHGRGGQSALRFARLRLEKRHNYLRKVAEVSTSVFITNDKVNVIGIVLAGSADFKNDLLHSDMFDQRLFSKVIKIVDISYGGDNGFNQAIELSAEALQNVKFIQEKKLIGKFFEEIAQDTGKVVYGIEDTLKALEIGAVELLILYEGLDIIRLTTRNNVTNQTKTIHISPQDEKQESLYKENNVELEVVEKISLTDWVINNYKKYGASLDFVTNKSQEGAQFQKGFGGFGGMLRYKLDFNLYDEDVESDVELF
ncbi:peptide chain release factor subunit 1, putative [Plasmodium ovale wallikeri]|uniref:Eukaryotic peptide chain release factor subunit 1 n=1 Tax=Plasmodium ovale wallikeri TaxID=864142 RepID=A0A1A8YJG2_PLAOA|nr:peptide chain release factor subunit 1, putative [Plasmodium ovale wallikeri]